MRENYVRLVSSPSLVVLSCHPSIVIGLDTRLSVSIQTFLLSSTSLSKKNYPISIGYVSTVGYICHRFISLSNNRSISTRVETTNIS